MGFTDALMTEAVCHCSSCSIFSSINLSGSILNFFVFMSHGLINISSAIGFV